MAGERFLGRWSRLKRDADAAQKHTDPVPSDPDFSRPQGTADSPASVAAIPAAAARALPVPGGEAAAAAGMLTDREGAPAGGRLELPSIDSLGMDSDFSLFMRAEVDPALRTSALKKLFTDPHFNRMDGLDIYIDDYSKPDQMPLAMLKRLNQSKILSLMDEEPAQAGVAQSIEAADCRPDDGIGTGAPSAGVCPAPGPVADSGVCAGSGSPTPQPNSRQAS